MGEQMESEESALENQWAEWAEGFARRKLREVCWIRGDYSQAPKPFKVLSGHLAKEVLENAPVQLFADPSIPPAELVGFLYAMIAFIQGLCMERGERTIQ
jgi:hypothetical protein